ncbi:MAG TPA: penicillin-binding transpeptidase domain-containing protein [Conexibacter sp.]|nr:penicillin-binding transpeptidase domain-containing protein [Conexibacter sp.]
MADRPIRRARPARRALPHSPPRPPVRPRRPQPTSPRARIIALSALGLGVVVILALTAVVLITGGRDDTPTNRLDAFLAAWARGDDATAARTTDAPANAAAGLRANRAGLDGARLRAERVGDVSEQGDRATARVRLTWDVPVLGDFSYTTTVKLRDDSRDGWVVDWAPTVVHPQLRSGTRLGTVRTAQGRGRLLDRNGFALVEERPVKRVGVVAGEISDPAATAQAIADAVEIDPRPFQRAIENGGRAQFVEAISLRPEDYAPLEAEIVAIPGARVLDATAQLAPARGFGRALLGDVRELSAEQLRRLGPAYAVGDAGGQWGLEAAFERELAGTASRAIVIRGRDGSPQETLKRASGERATDVSTTLDADVQAAAEQALDEALGDDEEKRAALVAVQPSSGDILAAANRPIDDSFNRAFDGQYPPGSTFKVVTTDALLSAGIVRPDTTVDCPTTIDVGGRQFKNFEGGGGGEEPFADAFAESCNTAFVGLASRLSEGALPEAGRAFGLGARFDLPVPAYGGQVPEPRDLTATAAAMIGQDKILASPLGMAGVIATVADGSWRPPRLAADDPRVDGTPLDAEITEQLRDLTRQVVTSGTGTALVYLSGEPHGKSGTAEYGSGDPPPTHAWFIAYRDDVAVAVLVEDGVAGGEVAAPIANDFFENLDAGVGVESLVDSTSTDTTG